MIEIKDKSQCCGCNACVQKCPRQCITMQEDRQGFLYPKVDGTLCIDCHLCEKVCPVLKQNEPAPPLHVLAAKNTNDNQRLKSSSGGIFILLAETIIRQGGVVFGARFNKNWEVEHCYVERKEELECLLKSKYVQSFIGNTFQEAEHFLRIGRKVMFVGTPCQISALKNYLVKDYSNLLAVDIICHGVPGTGVWNKYLNELVYSNGINLKNITDILFRAKQTEGFNWEQYGFVVKYKTPKADNIKRYAVKAGKNQYMLAFTKNYTLRPSCYDCPAKCGKSNSDITIGDYWGAFKYIPRLYDKKGLGLAIVHSTVGVEAINAIKSQIICKECDMRVVQDCNKAYFDSAIKPENYDAFWDDYFLLGSLVEVVDKLTYIPKYIIIKKQIITSLKSVIKLLIGYNHFQLWRAKRKSVY